VNLHQHARLTPLGRQAAVDRVAAGESIASLAVALGISRQTLYKWVRRLRASDAPGRAALDRPSTPHTSPARLRRTKRRQIAKKRAQRWSGARIAAYHDVPKSTVTAELRRLGLNRLPPVTPPEPVQRYERAAPGELVHFDIKKLGKIARVGHRMHGDRRQRERGIGWECVHVAIDDHSRLTYAEVLADETAATTVGFLQRAVAWFAEQGIVVERLLTDNGSAYRSLAFATACLELGISQRFTRAYRPQTNGKAERLIRTLLTEWAYHRAYSHSRWRTRALSPYLRYYNFERPHSALGGRPPASRCPAFL
jgi:transposase InsO family protein